MTAHDRNTAHSGVLALPGSHFPARPETASSARELDVLIARELYEAQQVLTYAAFRIPTGTYTAEQWHTLADTLDHLTSLAPHVRERPATATTDNR